MTATEARDPLDRYYTPGPCAASLVAAVDAWWLARMDAPRTIVEISVGGGSFIPHIRRHWPRAQVIGVDLDPEAKGLAMCGRAIVGDWVEVAPTLGRVDLAIGNPPFSGTTAIAHVGAALAIAEHVALILPWSFGGGVKRWRHIMQGERRPFAMRPIVPRPWPKHVRETAQYQWANGRHRGTDTREIEWSR